MAIGAVAVFVPGWKAIFVVSATARKRRIWRDRGLRMLRVVASVPRVLPGRRDRLALRGLSGVSRPWSGAGGICAPNRP